jgi:hypothetical protein
MSELEDSIAILDRSQQLELEGSIESTPSNSNHSEEESVSGYLPTPPFGHPSEEGIYMQELLVER